MTEIRRVAHRGYSAVAPENTLPALEAAVLAGATSVEFDVRTTADGVPVVIHDRTVDRTTDSSGPVWELTLDQVRALDAGTWFSPAYAGTRVPSLSEALDLLMPYVLPTGSAPAPECPIELLLEIKRPATLAEVETVLGQVADRGLLERTVVQSFDPDVIRLVCATDPGVRRGLLRLRIDDETVPLAKELDVACCNPPVGDVLADPATMAELRGAGIDVMAWTANDSTQWPALVEAGVAGLISDRVGALTGWSERLLGGGGQFLF